jgi:transcriptional regulator CtsR
MGISDLITQFLQEESESEADDGVLEVQRSDLAQRFNCVPSQINYVMSTRFSPEHGYIVESRRGGNGYIRITRVQVDRETLLMHVINSSWADTSWTCPPPGPSSAIWWNSGALEEDVGQDAAGVRRGIEALSRVPREHPGRRPGGRFVKQVLIHCVA